MVSVRPLRADRDLSEIEAVGHDWCQGRHAALEVTEPGAGAAVACDLLVMEAGDAGCKPDAKFGAGLVDCVWVLPVEGEARRGGDLEADFGVKPGHRSGGVEPPVIERRDSRSGPTRRSKRQPLTRSGPSLKPPAMSVERRA